MKEFFWTIIAVLTCFWLYLGTENRDEVVDKVVVSSQTWSLGIEEQKSVETELEVMKNNLIWEYLFSFFK